MVFDNKYKETYSTYSGDDVTARCDRGSYKVWSIVTLAK
jgi:hypothetical protein